LLALLDELLKSKTEGILRSEHHRRL